MRHASYYQRNGSFHLAMFADDTPLWKVWRWWIRIRLFTLYWAIRRKVKGPEWVWFNIGSEPPKEP